MEFLMRNWKTNEPITRKVTSSLKAVYRAKLDNGLELLFFEGDFYVNTKTNKIINSKKKPYRKYNCFILTTDQKLIWAGGLNSEPIAAIETIGYVSKKATMLVDEFYKLINFRGVISTK